MAIAIKYTEERYATVYSSVKHRDPNMEPAAYMMFRDNNQLNGIVSKHNRDKPKEPPPGKGDHKPDPPGTGKGQPPPADLSKLSRVELLALTRHAQLKLAETRERKKTGKGGGRKKTGKGK